MLLFKPLVAVAGIQRLSGSSASSSGLSNIQITVSEKELGYIPKNGAILTVSNRPVGAVEELILKKLLLDIRPDGSFLDNDFLKDADISESFNFKENSPTVLEELKISGACLSFFPVGNISEFQTPNLSFTDSKWNKELIKQIHESELPVIPIYIHVLNDNINKLLGMLHPALKARRLVSMLLEQQKIEVKVRIGKPIKQGNTEWQNTHQFGRFLRAKLYSLGSALEVEKFYTSIHEQPISEKIETQILKNELDQIRAENKIGEQGGFEVFLAKAKKMPGILNEIGRLREITFRNVGEGTLKSTDLDEFDLHYLHLFLWDKKQEKIAGAYRIGAGDYIMKSFGKKGFYLRSLFKIGNEMNAILEESIELGRSFVADEYQKNRLPLYLLWKGIAYFILKNPQLKYIIGPVSISSHYSKISRSLMVAYIKKYHWNEALAAYVKPKKAFKPDFKGLDFESLLAITRDDSKKFDSILEDMEPSNLKMPVLLKKYFKQNGKIISFNVDPDFNDSLDGFMISEIAKLPQEALEGF